MIMVGVFLFYGVLEMLGTCLILFTISMYWKNNEQNWQVDKNHKYSYTLFNNVVNL